VVFRFIEVSSLTLELIRMKLFLRDFRHFFKQVRTQNKPNLVKLSSKIEKNFSKWEHVQWKKSSKKLRSVTKIPKKLRSVKLKFCKITKKPSQKLQPFNSKQQALYKSSTRKISERDKTVITHICTNNNEKIIQLIIFALSHKCHNE